MSERKRNLTDKQAAFLAALFSEEAKGNPRAAMRIAGYSDATPVKEVTSALVDEISEETKKFIAQSAATAAYSMYEVVTRPTDLGNKDKINAAKDILDRAGFTKTDKVEVKSTSPLFILPDKKSDDDEDE